MIFPLILYNMPSGLILYFTFSNGFGILEQWVFRRHLDEGVAAGGAPSDGGLVNGKLVTKKEAGAGAGALRATEHGRKTAWDRQDEQQTRKAEKRKKKREQRERRSEGGSGGPK